MNNLLHWRNYAYSRICNWLATWLPTKEYRTYLAGLYLYGMNALARDEKEGREAPKDWREN